MNKSPHPDRFGRTYASPCAVDPPPPGEGKKRPHLLLTFPHRAGLSRKAGFFPRPACGERVVKSSEARLNRVRGRYHMREANDVKTVVPTASSATWRRAADHGSRAVVAGAPSPGSRADARHPTSPRKRGRGRRYRMTEPAGAILSIEELTLALPAGADRAF